MKIFAVVLILFSFSASALEIYPKDRLVLSIQGKGESKKLILSIYGKKIATY